MTFTAEPATLNKRMAFARTKMATFTFAIDQRRQFYVTRKSIESINQMDSLLFAVYAYGECDVRCELPVNQTRDICL